MSQMGMQLPGAQRSRRALPDVYTGLLLVVIVLLIAALVVVYFQAQTLAPEEGPLGVLKLQDPDRVQLPNLAD
jgi:hypothetical protein